MTEIEYLKLAYAALIQGAGASDGMMEAAEEAWRRLECAYVDRNVKRFLDIMHEGRRTRKVGGYWVHEYYHPMAKSTGWHEIVDMTKSVAGGVFIVDYHDLSGERDYTVELPIELCEYKGEDDAFIVGAMKKWLRDQQERWESEERKRRESIDRAMRLDKIRHLEAQLKQLYDEVNINPVEKKESS